MTYLIFTASVSFVLTVLAFEVVGKAVRVTTGSPQGRRHKRS
jgi:hypothetical protein